MATTDIVLSLLTELSILVTCTFLFGVLKPFLKPLNPRIRALVEGGLLGIFAIVMMYDPIVVTDGVLIDLRGVVIAVAGAFFGIVPASVACLLVILYRLSLGGIGAWLAIGAALTSAAIGIGFFYYRKQYPLWRRGAVIALGFAIALETILWLAFLPAELAGHVFSVVAFPIIVVYPTSIWAFAWLLRYQERHLELEESLNAERNMLRTLIDNVPDFMFIKDRSKRFILSNAAQAHAAGVAAPSDLLGRTAEAYFPAEVVAQPNADDQAVLAGQSIIAQERQTVNEDGSPRWLSTTKVPLLDAQGAVIGVVGISRNVTAYKQAEEALKHERNLLRTLIDAMPANVYIKDSQSRFVDANADAIRKLGGKTLSDLLGKTDFDFFGQELAAKYYADEQTVVRQGRPLFNIEEPTVDQQTQQNRWLLTTKVPIRNDHGVVTGLVGIGIDITERKRAEQALQVQAEDERLMQESLKALYEITIELTQIERLDDFYRRVVELALERLGFDRFGLLLYDAEHERLIGTYGTDAEGKLVAEHDLHFGSATLTDLLKRTLETTERFVFDQHAALYSNLEPIGFGWNAAAVLRIGEHRLGWLAADNGVHHQPVSKAQLDILALYAQTVGTLLGRTRAEEALRQNEAKLQTVFAVLPVGVSVVDSDGQIVEMNPALERITGMSLEGLLHGAYRSRRYIFSDGRPMQRSDFPSFRARVEQKSIQDVEVGIIKEGDTINWTSVSAAPLPGADSGVVTVTADITERKRAEEALRESETRFRQLMEHLHLAFWMITPDSGHMLYMSPAYETIWGRSRESVYQDPLSFMAAIHPDDVEHVRQVRQAGLPSGTYQVEFRVIRPDGSICWVLSRAFPIYDDQGKVYRIAGISEDITERKEAEEQAFALAAEQQRGKLLREFITDVSHDFRTPLSIIGTSAYLVSKTTDTLKLIQISQRVEEQISRLSLLLDNFLELAHLEQQASSLQFPPTDLDELLKSIIERTYQEVAAKNQHLDYQRESQSAFVVGDPVALNKAISQVVVNAIHYTPADGEIMLRLFRDGENAVVEVADTGVGIQPDDLPHIFDSFYRVDSARSAESGGAGLGLSLAKKIVELMKGRIEVQSEVAKGSVFRIYLPVAE